MLRPPPHKRLQLLVFLCLFSCMHSYTDRDALLCLKSQLYDPSGALAWWSNASSTSCDWHGVKCSTRHTSRVISLDLESLNLAGQIFPCIAELSFLARIHMPNNQLHGHVSPKIGRLTRLTYLNLSRNSFSGMIPDTISSRFRLEVISLEGNSLEGGIPSTIGNASSMYSLQLTRNNFQGSIPESISQLSSLQVLNLKDNNFSGFVPPAIYTNTSLTYLSLSLNHLVGRIPIDIGYTLPNITDLILAGNQFDGQIPASLGNASKLQNIDLRGNSLTGFIPSMGHLGMLATLDVGANMLKSGDWSFLSSLANCTQLQMLGLDFNGLGGTIPSSISDLSKNLEVLLLSENQLTGSIPLEIGHLTGLTVLVLQINALSGHIPDTLGNFQNLSLLDLSQNKFSGEIPESIGKLDQLTELYLMENNFTGQMPASLEGCKNLLLLNLSFNSFYGSIPKEIFSISTLSIGLDLSYNQLTGNIPSHIGSLMNLNVLSISNNQISGEIPSALGECLLLESLHLEANFLNGPIPTSLSSLRGINELDLSRNNLSGTIPHFLESFSSLYILNLSFNDLEGVVPKGGVFANSSAVFIQGNKKICACSPMQQVPLCTALSSKMKKSYVATIVVPLATAIIVSSLCLAFILLKKKHTGDERPLVQSFKSHTRFSYNDLFKATNGFSLANVIGSGRYGMVYKGQFGFDIIAIKVFMLDRFGASNSFFAECEALRNIRHRNLIRVINLCSTIDPRGNEFKALLLDYKQHGNLEKWLQQPLLNLGSRITIAMDIAAGLDYLHNRCSPPLVHCDLKPSNVLLDDEMVACLSDFGLGKFLHDDSSSGNSMSSSFAGRRGSVEYIAPEYGTGCKISTAGDVYSYGIILLQMITGKCPTDDMFNDGMNLHNFVEAEFSHEIGDIFEPSLTTYDGEGRDLPLSETKWFVKQLAKLGLKCSETSPKDRPTTEDVYAEIINIEEKFVSFYHSGNRSTLL